MIFTWGSFEFRDPNRKTEGNLRIKIQLCLIKAMTHSTASNWKEQLIMKLDCFLREIIQELDATDIPKKLGKHLEGLYTFPKQGE